MAPPVFFQEYWCTVIVSARLKPRILIFVSLRSLLLWSTRFCQWTLWFKSTHESCVARIYRMLQKLLRLTISRSSFKTLRNWVNVALLMEKMRCEGQSLIRPVGYHWKHHPPKNRHACRSNLSLFHGEVRMTPNAAWTFVRRKICGKWFALSWSLAVHWGPGE